VLERHYQPILIKRLRREFPGCVIIKNDTDYMQGIPDLTLLWGKKWAMLEVKASADAPEQPNQEFYVRELNAMSFAAFIYPENEEEVIGELQRALQPRRVTRFPKRQ
jgi:hypothetical protein